jgi:hypothetical protein
LDNGRTLNRWQVDKAIYIAQQQRRARQILENPVHERRKPGSRDPNEDKNVVAAYLLHRAVDMLAKNRSPDPDYRKQLLAKVLEAVAYNPREFAASRGEASPRGTETSARLQNGRSPEFRGERPPQSREPPTREEARGGLER